MLMLLSVQGDQCSIFSMVHPDYELLLELHTLTLVARSLCALAHSEWASGLSNTLAEGHFLVM